MNYSLEMQCMLARARVAALIEDRVRDAKAEIRLSVLSLRRQWNIPPPAPQVAPQEFVDVLNQKVFPQLGYHRIDGNWRWPVMQLGDIWVYDQHPSDLKYLFTKCPTEQRQVREDSQGLGVPGRLSPSNGVAYPGRQEK